MIFGARQGAGLALAQTARAKGWAVTAVVRPGADHRALVSAGCQIRTADALDREAVAAAFSGIPKDVQVVTTLGSRNLSVDDIGNRNVIDAARAHEASGLLMVSSLGAGDSRAHASPRLLAAIGPVLEAKTRAEESLRASGLKFAIIRPGGLVDGPQSGHGQMYQSQDVHGFISRGELGRLIFGLLANNHLHGQTLAALDPACQPPARYA
jgi:uncharacterized protein YbjT (DUF2867 family)